MELTKKQIEHIAKITESHLSFTNGWGISDMSYREHCVKVATKIARYLQRKKKRK